MKMNDVDINNVYLTVWKKVVYFWLKAVNSNETLTELPIIILFHLQRQFGLWDPWHFWSVLIFYLLKKEWYSIQIFFFCQIICKIIEKRRWTKLNKLLIISKAYSFIERIDTEIEIIMNLSKELQNTKNSNNDHL